MQLPVEQRWFFEQPKSGFVPDANKLASPCTILILTDITTQVAALKQTLPGLIQAVHMSYIQDQPVEGALVSAAAAPSAVPKITFLYKLAPGVADRSFGLNVARMAHLPPTVVDRAAEQALQMEQSVAARTR